MFEDKFHSELFQLIRIEMVANLQNCCSIFIVDVIEPELLAYGELQQVWKVSPTHRSKTIQAK